MSLPSTHPYAIVAPGANEVAGNIIRRSLVRWFNPNVYIGGGSLTWPMSIGNSIAIGGAAPRMSTTPGGRVVFDLSINTIGSDSTGTAGLTACTVDAWFRTKALTTTAVLYSEFSEALQTTLRSGISLIYDATRGNTLRVYGNNTTGTFDTSFQGGIPSNAWHNVCYVIPGTGSQRGVLYWNGTSNASATITYSRPGTSFHFFNTNGSIGQTLNGYLGDVKVYSAALTATEVKQNYNAMAPYYGRPTIA